MEPTYVPRRLPCIFLVLFLMSFGAFCNADLSKDREKCANQLVGLAGCLPYVGGDSKSPTADCCSGLKLVLQKSKECLCILIKDRNDPSLGLKVNATLALGLPEKCQAPANISECPALLHLAPDSPDAKVFEDFAKSGNGTSSSAPAQEGSPSTGNGSSANVKSDGGKGIRWSKVEMGFGILIIVVFHVLSNF